jgi:hypothetical protein
MVRRRAHGLVRVTATSYPEVIGARLEEVDMNGNAYLVIGGLMLIVIALVVTVVTALSEPADDLFTKTS